MSTLNEKLQMLGYNKTEFNGTSIFHNAEKHVIVFLDKQGNKITKKYDGNLKVNSNKFGLYAEISCGLEDIDEPLNIVITSNGTVYDLNWGEHVVECDNFIVMQSENSVMLYNKETKDKHRIEIFDCLKKNNAEFIIDSSSQLKLIAEDKLLIDGTYIDFKGEKIYQFVTSTMSREFIGISNSRMISYSKYGIDSNSNEYTKASINDSLTYFLINIAYGEVYKVLKTEKINQFKTRVTVSDFWYRNEKELIFETYECNEYDSNYIGEPLWI